MSRDFKRRDFVAAAGALAGATLWPAPATASGRRWLTRPADATVVLFQGDSITDSGRDRTVADPNSARALGSGYPLLVASAALAAYPDRGLRFYNRGISGNKVPDLQARWADDVLALKPDDAGTKVILAAVDFERRADTQQLHQTIDSVRATNPAAAPDIADWWLQCALAERDAAAAKDAVVAAGENPINLGNDVFSNHLFVLGVIAQMAKNDDVARSAFTAARAEQEKIVQAQPNFGPPWCVLGLIDAALGRKEEALLEGLRAVELLPVKEDAIRGPAMIKYLAMIAAWVGDKDLACKQLAIAVLPPSPVSYGQLKLLPFWDPLRGDPRFEQIVASLAPKGNLTTNRH